MQELQKQLLGLVQEDFPQAMYPAAMCALGDLREVGWIISAGKHSAMVNTCAALVGVHNSQHSSLAMLLSQPSPSVDQSYMALQIDEQDTLDRLVGEGAAGEAAALCQKNSPHGADSAEVRHKPTSIHP